MAPNCNGWPSRSSLTNPMPLPPVVTVQLPGAERWTPCMISTGRPAAISNEVRPGLTTIKPGKRLTCGYVGGRTHSRQVYASLGTRHHLILAEASFLASCRAKAAWNASAAPGVGRRISAPSSQPPGSRENAAVPSGPVTATMPDRSPCGAPNETRPRASGRAALAAALARPWASLDHEASQDPIGSTCRAASGGSRLGGCMSR
jgi:hypothetical protein